jgi:hypothetical protein
MEGSEVVKSLAVDVCCDVFVLFNIQEVADCVYIPMLYCFYEVSVDLVLLFPPEMPSVVLSLPFALIHERSVAQHLAMRNVHTHSVGL